MKKLILLIMLALSSLTTLAQKPLVGFTEEAIRTINKKEFPSVRFTREYQKDIWFIVSHLKEIKTFYFFEYGNQESVLCIQYVYDYDLAEALYVQIATKHKQINPKLFYEESTGYYIEIERNEDGNFLFTWSEHAFGVEE